MKVVGLCGASGAGKTTLAEQLLLGLRAAGQRVSTIKHTHHDFQIDRPGKDSWRLRAAGAYEVLIASDRRWAKIRELEQPVEPDVHGLIAELDACDWVLIEGFRHAELRKLEIWRAAVDRPPLYPHDPRVCAVVTDEPTLLPEPTRLPVLRLDQPQLVVDHLLLHAARHVYRPPAQSGA